MYKLFNAISNFIALAYEWPRIKREELHKDRYVADQKRIMELNKAMEPINEMRIKMGQPPIRYK